MNSDYLSISDLFLTQWIMAILSMGCKTDNFESHNSPKVSFTNIWGLHSNFAECEAFLQSNSSADILALCETNLGDSIDSGNFSVTSYLSLSERIQVLICNLYFNYSSCNLCEGDLTCRFLLTFTTGFNSLSVLFLFPLLITYFALMHGFLILFHLTWCSLDQPMFNFLTLWPLFMDRVQLPQG